MARKCTVCQHPDRDEIDWAILGGASYRHIASQYGLEYNAISRHRKHIKKSILKAFEEERSSQNHDLIQEAETLYRELRGVAFRALTEDNLRLVVSTDRAALGVLKALGLEAPAEETDERLMEVISNFEIMFKAVKETRAVKATEEGHIEGVPL